MRELNEMSSVTTGTDSPSPAPNTEQVGGEHYRKLAIQPWDFVIANKLDYFQGSIIKYITRWRDKNGVEDLYKARHFLNKYIQEEESK
jgi:hypothetical protein